MGNGAYGRNQQTTRRLSMSQENVETLREGYDAFSRGDIEAAFANFADDIVWRGTGESVPAGGTYNGIGEVRDKWLPEFAATYQDFSQSVDELLDCGDHVVALGTSKSSVGGQEIEGPFCHVWKYSEGKVVEASFFGDTGRVVQALQ
jgi:ketosteroid isomerase-like protein